MKIKHFLKWLLFFIPFAVLLWGLQLRNPTLPEFLIPQFSKEIFEHGKQIYQKQCAVCHGIEGGADGKAAYLLNPKPRNFISDKFRLVSTTNMEATDEDILKTISRGMPGSAMPSWAHLSMQDRWALVYYIRYLSEKSKFEKEGKDSQDWFQVEAMVHKKIDENNLIPVPEEPKVTPEDIVKGKEVFMASCAGCHGPEGKGDGGQKMVDNLGYSVRPRDLTAGIFKRDATSKELYYRMMAGLPGSPMPSYAGTFSQEQIWQLIHYVQSLSSPEIQEKIRLQVFSIKAQRMSEQISLDPLAECWAKAKGTFIPLTPLWWRDDRIEGFYLKALYDGERIAFYLTWEDPTLDDNVANVHAFSDGAAIQFSEEKDPPFFGMGDVKHPVVIWHWKSAWEKMGNERPDIETEYPHAAVDWYASQKNYEQGSPFEVKASETVLHDPQYLTGWGAGNPLSDPSKEESVEEATAEGLGTYQTQISQGDKVEAKGIWQDGKWHVVFVKPRQFKMDNSIRIAFALWDGSRGDRNGQKMISIWNELVLEK